MYSDVTELHSPVGNKVTRAKLYNLTAVLLCWQPSSWTCYLDKLESKLTSAVKSRFYAAGFHFTIATPVFIYSFYSYFIFYLRNPFDQHDQDEMEP